MPVNCTRLKPETLLRRLASDKNITGSVRLRAIELLILIENTAGLAKQMKPIKEIKQSELNSLTTSQTTPTQELRLVPVDLLGQLAEENLLSAAR